MGYSTLDLQARMAARGVDPGPVDGIMGPQTQDGARQFMRRHGHGIEADFHSSGLHRIIWHWTAGGHKANSTDLRHYHYVIEGDGAVVAGRYRPEDNTDAGDGIYGAHVKDLNTGSIGLSCAAMAGAIERPFNAGRYPLTQVQVEKMLEKTLDLCAMYDIPVSPWTTLMHSEVEPNLGVPQRAKWDLNYLPWNEGPIPAREAGDELREMMLR